LTYGDDAEIPHESVVELWHSIEAGLPNWSVRYPTATFVFLHIVCFGGLCDNEGYACRDGLILERVNELGDAAQHEALRRLVRYLGVELGDPPNFEPFRRGYFSATK
jgi:hypothetical protein